MTSRESNDVAIEVTNLTKRFGDLVAVNRLSFHVEPGRVTGFLGPNGAGKTTTLRMILGLIRPSEGTATIAGTAYRDLPRPLTTVGAALEATNFHPGRSGRNHLLCLAETAGIPAARVDHLLELVGIPAAARKRAGAYSMGMRQRLGLAAALLGDPRVIVCDEPANGLDPEGIRWLRGFLRGLAADGRTVLVSSHLLNEMQQVADDVVIIANGHLVRQGPIADLEGARKVYVRAADLTRLAGAISSTGLTPVPHDGGLLVADTDPAKVGELALAAGIALHELRPEGTDLEQLFFDLTERPENANRNTAPSSLPPPTGAPHRLDQPPAAPSAHPGGSR